MSFRPITENGPSENGPATNERKSDEITSAMKFSDEEQLFRKYLTLSIEEKLQKNRMIKDIMITVRKPVDKSVVAGWERKNGVSLPSDLMDFYLSTNGFKLTWSLEHAGDLLKIGEMNVNTIDELLALENLDTINARNASRQNTSSTKKKQEGTSNLSKMDLLQLRNMTIGTKKEDPAEACNFSAYFTELRKTMEANGQMRQQHEMPLHLDKNDKVFVLNQSRYGWISLVYPGTKNKRQRSEPESSQEQYVEIWFLDNSLQWHYLAPTFSHYYRMLLFHLGLPQWEYRFTAYGISAWAEQMFWLVAPHLLTPPKLLSVNKLDDIWTSEVPSHAANPNQTPNVISTQLFRRKKKEKAETVLRYPL